MVEIGGMSAGVRPKFARGVVMRTSGERVVDVNDR
jgi:hypothetical protein